MSLKDLTNDQLKEFIKDPKGFLESQDNYKRVFDLDDTTLAKKVADYEKELNLPPHSLVLDRPEAAK